ncbi:MAG: hypothetical protein OXD31_00140 [Chloroflexi bacterium]|nr:hypothetical protein [Chloroflexota bacterium]
MNQNEEIQRQIRDEILPDLRRDLANNIDLVGGYRARREAIAQFLGAPTPGHIVVSALDGLIENGDTWTQILSNMIEQAENLVGESE